MTSMTRGLASMTVHSKCDDDEICEWIALYNVDWPLDDDTPLLIHKLPFQRIAANTHSNNQSSSSNSREYRRLRSSQNDDLGVPDLAGRNP